MARLARLYVPGLPQLMVQRGNNRQTIFVDEHDRLQFYTWLREAAHEHRVAIHAYVLMTDHFHLLATPQTESDISKTLQAVGRRYVGWFNRRHGRAGTLWQGRYRSTVLVPTYLLACCRYVDSSPSRAGVALDPSSYRWSSAAHHVGLRVDPLVSDHAQVWALGNTPFERQAAYRALLADALSPNELQMIGDAMQKGWMLSEHEADAHWAEQANRRHRAMPRGRRKLNPTQPDRK